MLKLPPPVRLQKHAALWVARPLGGKDTQTDAHRELGYPVYHSGDALGKFAAEHRHDAVGTARHNGDLASNDLALRLTKIWVIRNLGSPLIHLNGMPRSTDQLVLLIPFLIQRGFTPMVIWFTTPEEVCLQRPVRPGRELEDTLATRAKRMRTYEEKTAPMLAMMQQDFGIRPENGNLLLLDNTHLTKEQTAARILTFLGVSLMARNLFPSSEHSSEAAVRSSGNKWSIFPEIPNHSLAPA